MTTLIVNSKVKNIWLTLAFISMTLFVTAQTDLYWNVSIKEEGKDFIKNDDPNTFAKSGFNLYKNCLYQFELVNQNILRGRLIDVQKDTLYLSNYLNTNEADRFYAELDTFPVYYKNLKSLRTGISKYKLDKFSFVFTQDSVENVVSSTYKQVFDDDTTFYEIVPTMNANHLSCVYEHSGLRYWYQGSTAKKPQLNTMDTSYTIKNAIWVIPNEVEQINPSYALGVRHESSKRNKRRGFTGFSIAPLRLNQKI